jgi:hypothetical protein
MGDAYLNLRTQLIQLVASHSGLDREVEDLYFEASILTLKLFPSDLAEDNISIINQENIKILKNNM